MSARIDTLLEMLQSNPNDCFLHHALALEYLKLGDTDQALQHFLANRSFDKNYVGTYYHLAKLYEKLQDTDKAIETYEEGMRVAQSLQDQHSLSELRSAYEELTF